MDEVYDTTKCCGLEYDYVDYLDWNSDYSTEWQITRMTSKYHIYANNIGGDGVVVEHNNTHDRSLFDLNSNNDIDLTRLFVDEEEIVDKLIDIMLLLK